VSAAVARMTPHLFIRRRGYFGKEDKASTKHKDLKAACRQPIVHHT
jgi:hypothetical protein